MRRNAKARIKSDPLLKETMDEILKIQPAFSPEPVFGPTGKGQMKSEGVSELQKIKETERKTSSKK